MPACANIFDSATVCDVIVVAVIDLLLQARPSSRTRQSFQDDGRDVR